MRIWTCRRLDFYLPIWWVDNRVFHVSLVSWNNFWIKYFLLAVSDINADHGLLLWICFHLHIESSWFNFTNKSGFWIGSQLYLIWKLFFLESIIIKSIWESWIAFIAFSCHYLDISVIAEFNQEMNGLIGMKYKRIFILKG